MCNYIFTCVLLIYLTSAFSSGQRNLYLPPDLPQDIMVDVINNFGVELLKKHNEYNENNLALSPYGAISVLVALKEGTTGDAQNEIQQTLHLPHDPSTVRIGLRDVLRRLKTYFIPEEGFLAGLTFNNDNISLKSDYKNLLMFYGYDVESFNMPLYPTTTRGNTVGPDVAVTEAVPDEQLTTTTKLIETTVTIKEEVEPKEDTDGMTMPSTEGDTATPEEINTTTTVSTLGAISTTESLEELSTPEMETTFSSSSTSQEYETSTLSTTPNEISTDSTTATSLSEPTTLSISTVPEESTSVSSTTPIVPTTILEESSETSNGSIPKRKRSPYNNAPSKYYLPSNTNSEILQNQQNPTKKSYEIDPSVISFLVDGKTPETNISFMTYKAILPYCYTPSLKSLALSFPLDSENYYLLIILPLDDCGADFVLERIGYEVTLRDIVASLTYTYVKATIPSFMLKGTVLLTPTLQKMGIASVFEPRKTDFSKMTEEKDIYVTNIEQLITVRIRNYIDPNHLDYFGNHYYQQNPVWFKADHPFLYFVMDSHLHVSLMAGKVTNPLNSRIS